MPFTNTSIQGGPYVMDGVATTFNFPFLALSADEVDVFRYNPTTKDMVELNGYNVLGIGAQGGTVKFAQAPNYPGEQLLIKANPRFSQIMNFENQDSFNPSDLNRELDRATQRDLVLYGMITSLGTGVAVIPPPDGGGDGGTEIDFTVTDYAKTLLALNNAAAWRAGLGVTFGNTAGTFVQGNDPRFTALANGADPNSCDMRKYLIAPEAEWSAAINRALLDKNECYVPPGAWPITGTVLLKSNQSLRGAGSGVSRLVSSSSALPCVKLDSNMFHFYIGQIGLFHSGTATVGGDGIQQGQGLADWVDNCTMEDVRCTDNYNGFNLGKAYFGNLGRCIASSNEQDGFRFTTTGQALVNGEAQGGPLQWVLTNCSAMVNGYNGYSYQTTGQSLGQFGLGSSVGTLINCTTYKNEHHAFSAIGSAAHPLHSIRIDGGFYGEDKGYGFYLDTFAADHSIAPQFVEAMGGYGVFISANNKRVLIKIQHMNSSFYDGVCAVNAQDLVVEGGLFVANGRAGAQGQGLTWCGVRIDGGSAMINNIRALDGGGNSQTYGISIKGDDTLVNGCRLGGNLTAPIVWATGPANSVVTGCMPASVNTGTAGGIVNGTYTGNLNVTGAVTVNGNVQSINGSIIANSGVVNAVNITATNNLTGGNDVIASNTLHVNGQSAFLGPINVLGSGGRLFINDGGIVALNGAIMGGLGIGTGTPGGVGNLNFTGNMTKNGAPYP